MIGLRASQDGACYPSYERIALDTGTTRRTAIRQVKLLTDTGWLLALPRCNGHGHQANAYQLLDPRLWKTQPENLWKTQGVVTQDHHLVTHVHPLGSDTRSPRRRRPKEEVAEPSADPVENPTLAAVLSLMGRKSRIPS
jgi:Helix-turn-helix domain